MGALSPIYGPGVALALTGTSLAPRFTVTADWKEIVLGLKGSLLFCSSAELDALARLSLEPAIWLWSCPAAGAGTVVTAVGAAGGGGDEDEDEDDNGCSAGAADTGEAGAPAAAEAPTKYVVEG